MKGKYPNLKGKYPNLKGKWYRIRDEAQTEVVYLVRDANLDLSAFFMVRWVASVAWVALAVAYGIFTDTRLGPLE